MGLFSKNFLFNLFQIQPKLRVSKKYLRLKLRTMYFLNFENVLFTVYGINNNM